MFDFMNIWEIVNDLLDRYEIDDIGVALETPAFLEELEIAENKYQQMLLEAIMDDIKNVLTSDRLELE